MTQPDAKLQAKWERILRERGLGVYQPMTDNSEGEMASVEHKASTKGREGGRGRGNDLDFVKLRSKLDGSDGFMEGHQITKVRAMTREIPEWSLSNAEVQRVLLTAFPNLKTRFRQGKRAGRWARIIYLYYRMNLPRQIVAKEMKMGEDTLKTTIRNISRVANGLTVMGGKRLHATPPTPSEGTTEGRHETIKGPLLHRAGNGSNGEAGTPKEKEVPLPQAG